MHRINQFQPQDLREAIEGSKILKKENPGKLRCGNLSGLPDGSERERT